MASTNLFNSALAANATTSPLTFALTAPVAGVDVQISTTFQSVRHEGYVASYAVSMDGGATYGEYDMFANEEGTDSHEEQYRIALNSGFDHIAIVVQNRDGAQAITSLKVDIGQF